MEKRAIISLIAAIGRNRELGKRSETQGDLLWRISDDLKRFKALTTGHPIIMGRKTFESIGRPLPSRTNIIVTRSPNLNSRHPMSGVKVTHSIGEALRIARESQGGERVFIIGGGEIYKEALPFATHLELTLIDAEDSAANVFFPEFEKDFKEVSREDPREESGITYTWVTYERT